jgi:hypothetical protein
VNIECYDRVEICRRDNGLTLKAVCLANIKLNARYWLLYHQRNKWQL